MPLYFVFVAGLLAWGAGLAWRWREVKHFAPEVLAAKKSDKEIPEDVTEVEFTDLYLRSEGPRGRPISSSARRSFSCCWGRSWRASMPSGTCSG